MSRKKAVLTVAGLVVLTTLFLALAADPALAASKIGKNVGKEVKSWGTALLMGTAALVGLPALAKRDVSQSLMIAVIVLILGGFLFASGTVKTVIDGIWSAVGA